MKQMNNKYTALVTGGTRGIGYAIAEKLLDDGMEVMTTGSSEDSNHPDGSTYHQVDFLNDESLNLFVRFIAEQPIDVLINNAGINKIAKFADIAIDDFDQILKINLRAPFILSQAVIPHMKSNNWGRIVNISSIFSHISKEFRASYSASKFGLDGLTAALSAELSQFGILANSVGPGFINTDMTRKILGEVGIRDIERQIPIKRLGDASEIASLVSWLASESNTYLTGQNILIDGGFTRV